MPQNLAKDDGHKRAMMMTLWFKSDLFKFDKALTMGGRTSALELREIFTSFISFSDFSGSFSEFHFLCLSLLTLKCFIPNLKNADNKNDGWLYRLLWLY